MNLFRILTFNTLCVALLATMIPTSLSAQQRVYRGGGTISLEEALERSTWRYQTRRPGLGAYTRRALNAKRTAAEQRTRNTRSERRTTGRIMGGKNSYARYLRSQRDNTQKVSRLRPGRVSTDQTADTEDNTR